MPEATVLRPRRAAAPAVLSGPRVEVRGQDALIAVPGGSLPVLRGDGVFALDPGVAAGVRG